MGEVFTALKQEWRLAKDNEQLRLRQKEEEARRFAMRTMFMSSKGKNVCRDELRRDHMAKIKNRKAEKARGRQGQQQ